MKGDDFQKRKTKKDKAKRNAELYGKFTPKHIRCQEEKLMIHAERNQQENSELSNKKIKRKRILILINQVFNIQVYLINEILFSKYNIIYA